MARIVFADDTAIENAECGLAGGVLWCYLPVGIGIVEAFQTFAEPGRLDKITFEYGGMTDIYEGFTQIFALLTRFDGAISVALKEGENDGTV